MVGQVEIYVCCSEYKRRRPGRAAGLEQAQGMGNNIGSWLSNNNSREEKSPCCMFLWFSAGLLSYNLLCCCVVALGLLKTRRTGFLGCSRGGERVYRFPLIETCPS